MSNLSYKPSAGLRLILSVSLGVWILLAIFPFFWTLWGSFKVEGDFFHGWIGVVAFLASKRLLKRARLSQDGAMAARGLIMAFGARP